MADSPRFKVYSLAKLLDFTMSGKTPVTTNSIEFRSVIDKATRTDPNERFSIVHGLHETEMTLDQYSGSFR